MCTPDSKGKALEKAVRAIEGAIVRSLPAYAEKTFVIESRKRLSVAGVTHEIDIMVTVQLGKGYDALFVFECKNWKDKVGKNEIIVFSEKIRATGAQRGYFVAKSFTKPARSQAELSPRMTLTVVSEVQPDELPSPLPFHTVWRKTVHISVGLWPPGQEGSRHGEPMALEGSKAILKGESIDLGSQVRKWGSRAAQEAMRQLPTAEMPDGDHPQKTSWRRRFAAGEFMVSGDEVALVELEVDYVVTVHHPAITPCFDIKTRGRAISYEPLVGPSGGQVTFTVVQTI